MAGRMRKKTLVMFGLAAALLLIAAVLLHHGVGNDSVSFEADERTAPRPVEENAARTMENERFLMTLDESSLGITLLDKVSGQEYRSTQDYTEGNDRWNRFCSSGISLEFYSERATTTSMVSVLGEDVDVSIQYESDGFAADLVFVPYDFRMQLQVRLTSQGLDVFVPGGSICEGEAYLLGAVWLYPMFGSTLPGEQAGYMVIPEGSGAVIDLADHGQKYKNPYTKDIYGPNAGISQTAKNYQNMPSVTEPEPVRMPVFGTVYSEAESGFLGIVTDGEYHAQIVAYPNGVSTPYNWVTAKFLVRDVYMKQSSRAEGVPAYEAEGDIRDLGLKYLFADEDEADDTGLANLYQDYLVSEGVLKKNEDSFAVKIDLLGADAEKRLVFDRIVPMTTVEDISRIAEDLQAGGAKSFSMVYIGYQDGGKTRNYGSTQIEIAKELGSVPKLRALADQMKENGIRFELGQELLYANSSRLYDTSKDIVKGINQVIVEVPTSQSYLKKLYFMTPLRASRIFEQLSAACEGTGLNAVSISGMTDTLYSYYSDGVLYSRSECALQYRKILEQSVFENAGMASPNVYLWDYMDEYYEIPMSTSGYHYIAREIPFLQTVLRGYVPYWAPYTNFQANERESFLKLLEYGAYPSFLLTAQSPVKLKKTNSSDVYTSQYSVWKEEILRYERELREVFGRIEGSGIRRHTQLSSDVAVTEYKNGIRIYVNYSTEDYYDYDEEITVPPMSYIVEE